MTQPVTLGEQLKKLRQTRNFSQPELATLVGIEQSYLSKLENDKSIPSNDIFKQLLKALKIDLAAFMHSFNYKKVYEQVVQIPMIEQWLNQQQKQNIHSQRRYLYSCAALIVIAVTLFYTGFSKQIFPETYQQYYSLGVILPGEPEEIFTKWDEFSDITNRAAYKAKQLEIAQRKNEQIILTTKNLGERFKKTVSGGTRLYKRDLPQQISRPINAWLQVAGVLLFTIGMVGFVLERRFYKT